MNSRVLLTLGSILFLCVSGLAQEQTCSDIDSVAKMMRMQSMKTLLHAKQGSNDSYRARLVFAYRAFELRHLKADAERLLALIPKNDSEQTTMMTLGDSLCDGEAGADMLALSRVRDGLASQLAKAIAVAPQFIPAYVRYSLNATADPHSDFAVQMRSVCQKDHARFLSAVKTLAKDEEVRFKKHVMNPDTCRAIALPEAE